MNYQETETLRASREYKAAEALTDSINSMSWNPKKFGLAIKYATQNFTAIPYEVVCGNYPCYGK